MSILALVPAFDPGPEALRASLASLLAQTMPCDICLVDDGSQEPIVPPFRDERIHIIRLAKNSGITAALRTGVAYGLARGYKYIARLDVGDLAWPDRMERQFAHMQAHGEVDMLGGMARIVDCNGIELARFGKPGRAAVRRYLWLNPAFRHSSFFFRASALERLGNYDPAFPLAQDYEIMLRMARHGVVDCLDAMVIDYLDDPEGLTGRHRKRQTLMRIKAQFRHAAPLNPRWYLGPVRAAAALAWPRRLRRPGGF